jgi:hypothetical protein
MIRFQAPLVALLALTASAASAETYTPALACRSVEALVAREGAATLYTGGGEYDRYVASQTQCQRDEEARPGYARTADSASCFVGYYCKPYFSNRR